MPINNINTDQLDTRNTKFLVKEFEEMLPPQRTSQDFDSHYNDGVLCGNWQENIGKYVRNIFPVTSEYRKEYNQPNVTEKKRDLYFDNKIRGEGTDWHTVCDQGAPEQYYHNFSTIYGLTYNRPCPKLIDRPPKVFHSSTNSYLPQQDLMKNYGNTTDYGLRKFMMDKWKSEKVVDIGDAKTSNQVTFVPHELPRFYKRKSPLKAVSSSFCKISTMNPDLKLKNKNLLLCSDIPPEVLLFAGRKPHKIVPNM